MTISSILVRIAFSLVLHCYLAFAAFADTGRRVALVVGNGAYPERPQPPQPAERRQGRGCGPARARFRGDRGGRPRPPRHAGSDRRVLGQARGRRRRPVLLCWPRPSGRRRELSGSDRCSPAARGQVRYQTMPLETVLADHGGDGRHPHRPARRLPRQPAGPAAQAQHGRESLHRRRSGPGRSPNRRWHPDRLRHRPGRRCQRRGRSSTARSPRRCSSISRRRDWRCGRCSVACGTRY